MINFLSMFNAIDQILAAETDVTFHYVTNITAGFPLMLEFARGSYKHNMPWSDKVHSLLPAIDPDERLTLDIELVDWAADNMMVAEQINQFVRNLKPVKLAARYYMNDQDRASIRQEAEEDDYIPDECQALGLTFQIQLTSYDWHGQATGLNFEYFFTTEELALIESAAT